VCVCVCVFLLAVGSGLVANPCGWMDGRCKMDGWMGVVG
jgi:hypothetical protein